MIPFHFEYERYPEIIARSLAVYLFIVFAIRFFGKKELSQLSVTDLVFILLISNSVQNAMVGPSTSLDGGLVAALSLFIANYIMKKLIFKHKAVSEFIQGKPVLLVYKGEIQHHNMKALEISMDELNAAVREHGYDDLDKIELAMMEVDGNISVVSEQSDKVTVYNSHNRHRFKGRVMKR